ncbi:MAG: DUF4105 domain-containing protein, partial [Granulosicoccus sp.]|nr:DUF4105 domain-containing protein [Granulosicoccus sp.]
MRMFKVLATLIFSACLVVHASSVQPAEQMSTTATPTTTAGATPTTTAGATATVAAWRLAANQGAYDQAVALAADDETDSALSKLLAAARDRNLATDSQWRSFLHYKSTFAGSWKSQVDAPHFFLSVNGKRDPEAELEATLAAFFSDTPKPPLRLTAYCRFVARRYWLTEQLAMHADLLPHRDCLEFDRFVDYLDADTLTLVFPTAHPNSPSSAFGHTLLRVDKKEQRQESRLLNMSINFAAEVPPGVSSAAYAIRGLGGGFPGRFRMLPYHMKLREYSQIENRDTWEYPLILDKRSVDLVLRHAYEMLISEFDYFFFSENCSYHLLSLLEVARPSTPLTDDFGLWTIPVDTIRALRAVGLADQGRFIPSSIRTLRARRAGMSEGEARMALEALATDLHGLDESLAVLDAAGQANVLDLLSDYERYDRLKSNPSAQGSNDRERTILSRRSRLGVRTIQPDVVPPAAPPDAGHGTARLSVLYHETEKGPPIAELQLRPAYHDFRDPSAAFDDKAAIQLGLIGVARDLEDDRSFVRRFTLIRIESIEPRGEFFKPISWHTRLDWQRRTADARHEFT